MFRASPQNPVGEGGKMALADHLRELRARVLRALVLFGVVAVAALFFYDQLLDLVLGPYEAAQEDLSGEVDTRSYISGAGGPLVVQLKLSALAAVVLTSPYWLYQIWAFILPGLHAHERKWSRVFAAVAGPLFLAGVAVGYYLLPKGLEVLIGFTPDRLENLVEFGDYFSFFVRMLLVFGIAFEIPVFIVLLSAAGVVSGKTLGEYRAWIVVAIFVFAAVATPSTDPFSMLGLAIPVMVLFFISEVIARVIDRRRAKAAGLEGLSDDEQSMIDLDDEVYRPSSLSEQDD